MKIRNLMQTGTWFVYTLSGALTLGCSDLPVDGASDGDLGVASQAYTEAFACQLSDQLNPNYRTEWDAIANDPAKENMFWHDLVPNASSPCADHVRSMLWERAVPMNWTSVPRISASWPWATGGYFTQQLWLRAVPENWNNGHYRQAFWNHAVPENWGPPFNMLGRDEKRSDGVAGYYNYFLWRRAVPEEWAGYYKQVFWQHAVPEEWAKPCTPVEAAQDVWHQACTNPPAPVRAVGGVAERGYYLAELYHFAMVYDWPYENSPGAGYYGPYVHTQATLPTMPQQARDVYTELLTLAGAPGHGQLANTTEDAPVQDWFDPQAHAVVIFTFDNHGERATASDEACALKRVLLVNDYDYSSDNDPSNDECVSPGEGVGRATMFLSGNGDVASECLANFHLGNHTYNHPNINRQSETNIDLEIKTLDECQNAGIGFGCGQYGNHLGRSLTAQNTFTAFRAPFCDGKKTFDAEVGDRFVAFGEARGVYLMSPSSVMSDSSVGYLSASVEAMLAADSNGAHPVPPGIKAFMTRKPYPYYARPGLVELPYAYPSDGGAGSLHNRETFWTDHTTGGRQGYALDVWKAAFNEIYAARGVMTVLLHPNIMVHWEAGCGNEAPTLRALIRYMRSFPGVRFSDMGQAATRFAQHYPSP